MRREDLLAPEQYNIVDEFEKYAKDDKKIALLWEDEEGNKKQITYKGLLERVNQFGHVFLQEGLKKGDVILIMVPRIMEAYISYVAALKLGLVIIPSSEMLRKKDIEYRFNHAEVKAIIAYEPYLEQFEEIDSMESITKFVVGQGEGWIPLLQRADECDITLEKVATSKDDMAFLGYTSGTTGNPKGVVHTHSWAYAHIRTASTSWLGIKENDIVWATAGPGWVKWVWSPFLSVLGTGATGFCYHGRFEPKKYLQLMHENNVNVLCATPTEYRIMAKVENLDQYNLSCLREAVSAGEPLNREVINTFEKYFNITVRDGYGQTENTLLVGNLIGMEVRPGSMGKPTPGNTIEIIDEFGRPVALGEVGDIGVHRETPALFKYYYKDPERTLRQYRGDYYLTGDQAKKDEDGYFWFEGRGDDIIISAGYTIGPFEVEDALVKHPAVKECAVVASPDEIRGSIVKAFVVVKDDIVCNDDLVKVLQEHVKELTAPYKYPRKIEFVEDLPKTASGKIRRVELRMREHELASK
ncbi:MAG: acyl-CoA synthetase MbcS [Bacillaceae bacterium]